MESRGRINELLSRRDIAKGRPGLRREIDAIADRFGVALPPGLVTLWTASGEGIVLPKANAHFLGPSEVLGLVAMGWPAELIARGFVPLLDDHQSNYLALLVRPPLAYRVAYVPHDDGSRLIYRDLESCVADVLRVLVGDGDGDGRNADLYLRRAHGDYPPDAPRPIEDQAAARELLKAGHHQEDWNYAAQLLDASNVHEWATLLETEHFVRRDVRARMKRMRSPEIRELLRQDEARFNAFADSVAQAARQAGLSVGERRGEVLQVGGKWMNLDGFFYRRSIPDALPRIIDWFNDLLAGRNPHTRPGHFDSD